MKEPEITEELIDDIYAYLLSRVQSLDNINEILPILQEKNIIRIPSKDWKQEHSTYEPQGYILHTDKDGIVWWELKQEFRVNSIK